MDLRRISPLAADNGRDQMGHPMALAGEGPHLASCVWIGVLLNELAGLLGTPMVVKPVSGQSGRQ
jgi:hypothetical protein